MSGNKECTLRKQFISSRNARYRIGLCKLLFGLTRKAIRRVLQLCFKRLNYYTLPSCFVRLLGEIKRTLRTQKDRFAIFNHRFAGLLIVLLALLLGCATETEFKVVETSTLEMKPAVAYNTITKEFMVAYLKEQTNLWGNPLELRVKRFNANGEQQGQEIQPLGSGSHVALGRPAIAYSPNSDRFFVAVPERVTGTGDRVIGRFLDANGGTLPGPEFLLEHAIATYYDGAGNASGNGSLHVTHNSILDEFLVTVQRTISGDNGVWAQRVSEFGGLSSQTLLYSCGIHGFDSHGIAYAPVANTTPAGGRYLFTVAGNPMLLDAHAQPIMVTAAPNNPNVPTSSFILLNKGKPEGNYAHFDIAYGEVEGKKRFLLVYSDGDNCKPGPQETCPNPQDQWTGVWGTYVNPERLHYTESIPRHNTPFPISKIVTHVGNRYEYKPRVTYSADVKAFFVVWREYPFYDSQNDESRSHIRGNRVDYFVDDGLYGSTIVQKPHDNVVISKVTGPYTAVGSLCPSIEDPNFPDVAAIGGNNAAVVWHQKSPLSSGDLNVSGAVVEFP